MNKFTPVTMEEMVKVATPAIEKKKQEMLTALRNATPVDTGEARAGWHIEGDKIVNNVEHINELNDGSSRQAPPFFIEKALLSVEGVSANGTIVKE